MQYTNKLSNIDYVEVRREGLEMELGDTYI